MATDSAAHVAIVACAAFTCAGVHAASIRPCCEERALRSSTWLVRFATSRSSMLARSSAAARSRDEFVCESRASLSACSLSVRASMRAAAYCLWTLSLSRSARASETWNSRLSLYCRSCASRCTRSARMTLLSGKSLGLMFQSWWSPICVACLKRGFGRFAGAVIGWRSRACRAWHLLTGADAPVTATASTTRSTSGDHVTARACTMGLRSAVASEVTHSFSHSDPSRLTRRSDSCTPRRSR